MVFDPASIQCATCVERACNLYSLCRSAVDAVQQFDICTATQPKQTGTSLVYLVCYRSPASLQRIHSQGWHLYSLTALRIEEDYSASTVASFTGAHGVKHCHPLE